MEKTCFVIGPIGDEGSPPRRHADWVLDGIVNPALERAGLPHAIRADKIATPGMIDSQVISNVLDADLVIADLTTSNPNAFYELALRHMAEKPIIHLIHKSELKIIPFDVAPYRTIDVSWDTPAEALRSVERLHEQVQEAISPEHVVENPVTKARGRQHLKATASPAENVLLEELQGLSARVAELERRPAYNSPSAPTGPSPGHTISSFYYYPSAPTGPTGPPLVNELALWTSANAGKAFVRDLNGKAAVLLLGGDPTDGKVTLSVDGQEVRLPIEEWNKLPVWKLPSPR
jgi:hypothetical protein